MYSRNRADAILTVSLGFEVTRVFFNARCEHATSHLRSISSDVILNGTRNRNPEPQKVLGDPQTEREHLSGNLEEEKSILERRMFRGKLARVVVVTPHGLHSCFVGLLRRCVMTVAILDRDCCDDTESVFANFFREAAKRRLWRRILRGGASDPSGRVNDHLASGSVTLWARKLRLLRSLDPKPFGRSTAPRRPYFARYESRAFSLRAKKSGAFGLRPQQTDAFSFAATNAASLYERCWSAAIVPASSVRSRG